MTREEVERTGGTKNNLGCIIFLVACIICALLSFSCKNDFNSDNPESQYNLGLRYLDGQGVAKDDKKAVELFMKAAEQDFAKAQSGTVPARINE